MAPLISIVMPAYNAARYLTASIASVKCQTFTDWELLVIDDGSTDSTAEIARSCADDDSRIRVFSQSNGGQAEARNAGLAAARGELVAFLDADDLWTCDKLGKQLSVMQQANADLVFSDGDFFSDDRQLTEDERFDIVAGRTEGLEMFRLLFQRNRIATLSVLVKKNLLDQAGGFDADRKHQNCEDYDLWLTLAKRGAVFYGMPEKLMKYRRHSQASTSIASNLLKPMLQVIKKHSSERILTSAEVKTKVRWLYRELVSALVKENQLREAKDYMREFASWDQRYITSLQKILLNLAPGSFNYLSRELLYRTEWHLGRGGAAKSRMSRSSV